MCKHFIRVVLYFDLYTKLVTSWSFTLCINYGFCTQCTAYCHCREGHNIVNRVTTLSRRQENQKTMLSGQQSPCSCWPIGRKKCFWATKFWGMLVNRQLVGKRWFPKKRLWCFFFSPPTSSVSSLLSSWKLLLDLGKGEEFSIVRCRKK